MAVRSIAQAFATVFPAELPDKTMIATVLLVARFRRPLPVWIGAVSAFTVHVVVAVAAGKALSLLPKTPVQIGVTVMFLAGAVLLLRAARSADDEQGQHDPNSDTAAQASTWGTVLGSFSLIIVAEWGDLTQLATASLAAKNADPVGTGIGALAALVCVAGIAATFGRQLVARVSLSRINYIGAAVFGALAVWTVYELVAA